MERGGEIVGRSGPGDRLLESLVQRQVLAEQPPVVQLREPTGHEGGDEPFPLGRGVLLARLLTQTLGEGGGGGATRGGASRAVMSIFSREP